MADKKRFVISCGKTGGHLFPAIAVAQELKSVFNDKVEMLFFISGKDLEREILNKAGFNSSAVPGEPWTRKFSFAFFKFFFSHIHGTLKVLFKFLRRRPVGVLITGGFTSFPVGVGAVLLRIPLFIQEQNIFPGIVNRILAPFARTVFMPFEDAGKFIKSKNIVISGNPLRKEIEEFMIKNEKRTENKKFTLFFTGGSQGAVSIAKAAIEFLKLVKENNLEDEFRVYLHTGKREFREIDEMVNNLNLKMDIEVNSFFYNIYDIYLATDLIICRAGAMTISEITVFGIPSILVPYPYATGDHQAKNAAMVVDNEAGYMFNDNEIKGENIFKITMQLRVNKALLDSLRKNARKLGIISGRKVIAEKIYNQTKKKDESLSCF